MADPVSDRTTVRRRPERARYERDQIEGILDEALTCHVGFVADDQPFVIPTIHARLGDRVYLHGSPASRLLRAAAAGSPLCLTVTLVDGLVLARSAFHHSINYRSVVILGTAIPVDDPEQKRAALDAVVEAIARGRSVEARPPTDKELRATTVVSLAIEEASAKVRTGPPVDDEEDYALEVWAGVLPLRTVPGEPLADPRLPAGIAPGPSVTGWSATTAAAAP